VNGITPTRNRGFNEVKSEIIARIDADSLPPRNWIGMLKKEFEDPEVHAVTGPVTLYDAPLKTTFFSQFFFYSVYFYLHHHVLFGPNMAIRKSVWDDIKDSLCAQDREVHEDIDISFHMKDPGKHIKYDKHLVSSASARRIMHNPQSFFGEYTMRLIHMMKTHNKIPVAKIASYFD
jgi:cellulose synthase/poly-beta-1,6-N-acetylglucosamine synthase-like glycosyltransferase